MHIAAPGRPGFRLQGKPEHQIASFILVLKSTWEVIAKRYRVSPDWPWDFEISMRIMRGLSEMAFRQTDIQTAREIQDSLVFDPPTPISLDFSPSAPGEPKSHWYNSAAAIDGRMLLYFHGGGYAFYTAGIRGLMAYVADACRSRMLALDYRLTPEHRYPAQLDDAVAAYRWLLDRGTSPSEMIVAGDSAGGHLLLTTLQRLRDLGLPQPALGIGICPWTDIGNRGDSLFENDRYDWVQGHMALKFGDWFSDGRDDARSALSPIYHSLTGLAPLYLLTGGREILHDMIVDFAAEAVRQGAEVTLDDWPHMTHDFPAFGKSIPDSAEALSRISAAADHYLSPDASKRSLAACPRTVHQWTRNLDS